MSIHGKLGELTCDPFPHTSRNALQTFSRELALYFSHLGSFSGLFDLMAARPDWCERAVPNGWQVVWQGGALKRLKSSN